MPPKQKLLPKGGRYLKRKPLTEKEHKFLKDFYYNKSGFAGRDVLFNQLKAHYAKEDTPKDERISRRRMWDSSSTSRRPARYTVLLPGSRE